MRIKLVVVNEHTLGYIEPGRPHTLCVLRSSVLRGAPFTTMNDPRFLSPSDRVRLAGRQDFEDYRICFDGYEDESIYEYQTAKK